MSSTDKIIINEEQLQEWVETQRRRREIVAWVMSHRYEFYMELSLQYAYLDQAKSEDYFNAAKQWREFAETINDLNQTQDHTINLIWLGEITL